MSISLQYYKFLRFASSAKPTLRLIESVVIQKRKEWPATPDVKQEYRCQRYIKRTQEFGFEDYTI